MGMRCHIAAGRDLLCMRMRRSFSLLIPWFAACTAAPASTTPDATPDTSIGVPAVGPTVWVAMEGLTLMPAAGRDDPATDRSALVSAPTTLAPWGTPDDRAQLLGLFRYELAGYPITFTSERPSAGTYATLVMTASTGAVLNPQLGSAPGIQPGGCGQAPAQIMIVFATPSAGYTSTIQESTAAVSMIGAALGVPWSLVMGDCMSHTSSIPDDVPCTIGGADTEVAPTDNCHHGVTTMDEAAEWMRGLAAWH